MSKMKSEWLIMSQELDWDLTYVDKKSFYPEEMSYDLLSEESIETESYNNPKMTFFGYIRTQYEKELGIRSLRDAIGRVDDFQNLPPSWISSLKLNLATLPFTEFDCTVGALRNARFGQKSLWRQSSTYSALDHIRHTQIPLLISKELAKWDRHFDWTVQFFRTQNWFSIVNRHLFDELLLMSSAQDYVVGGQFIFKTIFSHYKLMALSMCARLSGDKLFEKVFQTIQSDEAKNTKIIFQNMEAFAKEDKLKLQSLIDKWFWRCWLPFAFTVGVTMDYLVPIDKRQQSFKEFVHEYLIPNFTEILDNLGLKLPWYWGEFLTSINYYHHMLYATVYTYRATLWFDLGVPFPEEREWLNRHYSNSWSSIEPVWKNIDAKWKENHSNEFYIHAKSLPAFCNTCQMPLSGGSPDHNTALFLQYENNHFIFCSEPCKRIFTLEPHLYSPFKGLIQRILEGQAPGNIFSLLDYFGLTQASAGQDLYKGNYKWIHQ